jgi:ankyrin repeat protein
MVQHEDYNPQIATLLLEKANVFARNNFGEEVAFTEPKGRFYDQMRDTANRNIMRHAVYQRRAEIDKQIANLTPTADINQVDHNGYSAVMRAAVAGNAVSLQASVNAGANIHLQTSHKSDRYSCAGKSALHLAAEAGKKDTAEILCNAGCDINLPDREGNTPLMLAAERGHPDMVRFLIEQGADITLKTKKKIEKHYSLRALDQAPRLETIPPKTALDIAIENYNPLVMDCLLEATKDQEALYSALKTAFDYSSSKMLSLCLNWVGMQASYPELKQHQELLKRHGDNSFEMMNQVLDRVDVTDINKDQIFVYALTYGNTQKVTECIAQGAVVNDPNRAQDAPTSLMVAAERGHVEVVKILLENGADIYATILTKYGEEQHAEIYAGSNAATKAISEHRYIARKLIDHLVEIVRAQDPAKVNPTMEDIAAIIPGGNKANFDKISTQYNLAGALKHNQEKDGWDRFADNVQDILHYICKFIGLPLKTDRIVKTKEEGYLLDAIAALKKGEVHRDSAQLAGAAEVSAVGGAKPQGRLSKTTL